MHKIILKTKQKSMELKTLNIDEWWNMVHNLLHKDVHGLFDEHRANLRQVSKRS
jgi:hypothetical protein